MQQLDVLADKVNQNVARMEDSQKVDTKTMNLTFGTTMQQAIVEVERLRERAKSDYADLIQQSPSANHVSSKIDAFTEAITALQSLSASSKETK